MFKFLKIAGLVIVLLFVVLILFSFFLQTQKSGYSNCVVAKNAGFFIGKNLKYEGNAERMTLKTEECIALDQKIDSGDGPENGRVRWVECPMGPDCDEAGLY